MFIDIRAAIASIFSCLGLALIGLGFGFSIMARESEVNAQPARAGELLTLLAAHEQGADGAENLVATRWPEQSERGRIFLSNTSGGRPDARVSRPVTGSTAIPDSAPAAIARVIDRADEKAAIQAAAAEALLLEQSREASRSATKLGAAPAIPLPVPRPRAVSTNSDPAAQASAREPAKRTALKPQNTQTAQTNKPKGLFESLFSR